MANPVAIGKGVTFGLQNVPRGTHVSKGAAAIAGANTKDLFTVSGGRVLVLGVLGTVTTAIQNQTCNTKIVANPTTGAEGDLSGTVNIANLAINTKYGIPGPTIAANAVVSTAGAPMHSAGLLVDEGVIGVNTSADNTGAMKWDIWYIPLDAGATITAA